MIKSDVIEKFYTSWRWRKCREAFANSKGNLCERCMKRGKINPGTKEQPLETHHKIHLTEKNINDPRITLCWDNLELLCHDCHEEERGRKPKRWRIGEDGKVFLDTPHR